MSPGYFLAEDGSSVVRVYAEIDLATAEQAAIEQTPQGFTAQVLPSRYTHAELTALHDSLPRIDTGPDGSFAARYDAEADIFVLTGNVPPEVIAARLGETPYQYDLTADPPRR